MNATKKARLLLLTACKLILCVYVIPFVILEIGDYMLDGLAYVLIIFPILMLWIYFFGKKLVARMVELRKEIDAEKN